MKPSNQSKTRVHFLRDLSPESKDLLTAALSPSIAFSSGEKLPQDDAIQVLVAGRITPEQLAALPALKMLVVPWAGIPEETRDLLRDAPVSVHNLHHNAAPTAETALALLFAAAKFIIPFDQALRRHNWQPRYTENPSVLLQGKTALILGYGEIGRHVGRVCRALNMDVLALRRHAPPGEHMQEGVHIYRSTALPELLPRTHVLLITMPLTEETRGMIGQHELNLMPPGGLLVNVGRGPVVDQAALYQALSGGRLAAAGLDVWYNYPEDEESRSHTPPSDYPFHTLENVVMSPHRGGEGGTQEIERLRMSALARLLNAAAAGQPVPNHIDLQAGY